MLPPRIHAFSDLVTSHRAVCEGFLRQAQAKTERATPYVEEAQLLLKALHEVASIELLLKNHQFRDDLIVAAGFSDKAIGHLSAAELDAAVKSVFEKVAASAGTAFREKIVYRFLLTKGDALRGSMRNLTGAHAGIELTRALLNALDKRGIVPSVYRGAEDKVQRIRWGTRRLLFDKKPSIIEKNIDVILLNESSAGSLTNAQLMARAERYVACGELKGGIDPAGADEHWKTAVSALDRIRSALKERCPPLFFVGAAIQSAMAQEIFAQLKNGRLAYAANLTVQDQLADLADWLVAI
jgi:hypothetical protein